MESSSRSGIKRPRSSTPSKGAGESTPLKKKKKGSKKSKSQKKQKASMMSSSGGGGGGGDPSSTSTSKPTQSSLDETATADGQMMARMLSTFSSLEQSRFAAYKRANFNARVVQDWIAICLQHRVGHVVDVSSKTTKHSKLADLVTPQTHNDIGMVAVTAAKVYAQRLVAAALKVAEENKDVNNNNSNSTNSALAASKSNKQMPLQPEHVWQACQERQQDGLDPGFYLQPNESLQFATVSSNKEHEQKRLAALEAQEAYEKLYGAPDENQNDSSDDDSEKKTATESSPKPMKGVVTTAVT